MEKTLFVLAALVFAAFCTDQSQKLCQGKPCPNYTIKATYSNFEIRLYPQTNWIVTKIKSKENVDVTAAYNRLKSYCDGNGEAGNNVRQSWPALVEFSELEGYTMEWFIPPGIVLHDVPGLPVKNKTSPSATIYVRSFEGLPSLKIGEENYDALRRDLILENKSFRSNPKSYIGAGYDSFFAPIHHNEIWIYAD